MFLVIEGADRRGGRLKESLEFMDVAHVEVVNAADWLEQVGERRLAAVFIGDDLDPKDVQRVVTQVGEHDPDVPIVRVRGADSPGETPTED